MPFCTLQAYPERCRIFAGSCPNKLGLADLPISYRRVIIMRGTCVKAEAVTASGKDDDHNLYSFVMVADGTHPQNASERLRERQRRGWLPVKIVLSAE